MATRSVATVFGGSGFIGRYIVKRLAHKGFVVRVAVRDTERALFLKPMGAVGQVVPLHASLTNEPTVQRAVDGADLVVNTVGILSERRAGDFNCIHAEGAGLVARLAAAAGVARLVHISAIGADPDAASRYAATKGIGEALLREAFPTATILRPSLVFGPEDELFNRFAAMAGYSPFLPLIGGGRTKLQPVYAGDVAMAIAAVCAGKGKPGTIYELGGPEVVTFRQLLDHTQEWSGRKRRYLRIPFWAAKLGALLTLPLPNGVRPLTVDQIRMLQSDNIVSKTAQAEGRVLAGLGIEHSHTMEAVVPGYLERFKPHGQFSHYH
jgi:NADH dehydrogenase